jgi:hypothetical protein
MLRAIFHSALLRLTLVHWWVRYLLYIRLSYRYFARAALLDVNQNRMRHDLLAPWKGESEPFNGIYACPR